MSDTTQPRQPDWQPAPGQDAQDLRAASRIVRASAVGPNFADTFCLANRIGFIADRLSAHFPQQGAGEVEVPSQFGDTPTPEQRKEWHPPATTAAVAHDRLKLLGRRLRYKADNYNADIAQMEVLPFLTALCVAPLPPSSTEARLRQIMFSTLTEVERLEEASVQQFHGPYAEPSASQNTLASLRGMLEHRLALFDAALAPASGPGKETNL